ncbi:MAG: DUF4115 domain-containing protein [Deltaproteobacteria bacterium]|nr:DUF4115 domain-containing protein [Deltaproteobacteria bacterium]
MDHSKTKDQFAALGKYLREARESKGLNIIDIAANTRINKKLIEKMEQGDLDGLPAMPFVRGFLRNYAQVVGLDEKWVVSEFNKIMDAQPEAVVPDNLTGGDVRIMPQIEMPAPKWIVAGVVGLLLLWGGVALFSQDDAPGSAPDSPPETKAESTSQAVPKTEDPPQTMEVLKPDSDTTDLRPARALRLTLTGVEKTWVRVSVDRNPPVEIWLTPKESKSWEANGEFRITLGHAAGVGAALNGKTLMIPGPSDGLVHNFVINSATLKKLP